MLDEANRNKRIAKNTILLYFRMLLLMVVSLYTSRVVLETLGIEDYGIYNVVGGFVSMFAFLNGAMSASTQRYITFALGKGDIEELKQVFSSCVLTHMVIAFIVLALAETLGLWFVMHKLVIPSDQINAALVVYQCSVFSTILTILSFPFNADIIAHEHMAAFAYISIFEAAAKLGIVYLLLLSNTNKLISYALLLVVVNVVVISIYNCYCRKFFIESRFKCVYKKNIFNELFSFTGWSLLGCLSVALCSQGVNIILNMFFGPIINAARGIAVQVQGAVQQFASSFQTAINPQITKAYAANEYNYMFSLINRSSKFTFLLLIVLILPLYYELDWILSIWLVEVPEYTGVFAKLILVATVFDSMANPMIIAVNATGKVKIYQIITSSLTILTLPISYFVLKFGYAPYYALFVQVVIVASVFLVRLFIVKRMIHLSIKNYARAVIRPCLIVLSTAGILCYMIYNILPHFSLMENILSIMMLVATTAICGFFWGLTVKERTFIQNKIILFRNKFL